MTPQSRTTILALLERHGLSPRKAYGQHFLADPNLIDKIVAVAGVRPDDSVLEVGAGTGVLTSALSATGARVVAFEVDERFRPVLAETLEGAEVDLRFGDIMDVDLVSELGAGRWKMVANLPYNVGTPLMLEVLLHVDSVRSMTVMVQQEVAARLVASPSTADYGVPSVVVALTARVVERFRVPPQVFIPPPQVSSSVVRLDRVDPPALIQEAVDLARAAFGQRRKMLRRSLADRLPETAFARAGIDPTSRPEQLTPGAFVDLAEALSDG